MKIVYANATAQVGTANGPLLVGKGTHWPDGDPVVRAHPELFSDDPRFGLVFTAEPEGWDAPPVEQATAGPGERRNTRRT